MVKRLYSRNIDPRLVVHLALRSKKYDSYATKFLEKHRKVRLSIWDVAGRAFFQDRQWEMPSI